MKYDVIIVGAGPAGIFTAYELVRKSPDLDVLLIDKGHDIFKRHCPILEKKIKKMPPSSGKKGFQRLPAGLFNNKRLRGSRGLLGW